MNGVSRWLRRLFEHQHRYEPVYVLLRSSIPEDQHTSLYIERDCVYSHSQCYCGNVERSEKMQAARRDLPQRMRKRADADQLPLDHELRDLADKLDAAVTGFYSQPQTVPVAKFVGAWARARRTWCAYSGEPLI